MRAGNNAQRATFSAQRVEKEHDFDKFISELLYILIAVRVPVVIAQLLGKSVHAFGPHPDKVFAQQIPYGRINAIVGNKVHKGRMQFDKWLLPDHITATRYMPQQCAADAFADLGSGSQFPPL